MGGSTVKLDDLSAFVDLCRRSQRRRLHPGEAVELEKWAARHGEGMLATIAEVQRTLEDVLSVQRLQQESLETLQSSLGLLKTAVEGLRLSNEATARRVAALEQAMCTEPS